MKAMHYDDGFDMLAPPEPPMDLQTSHPPKIVSEEDHCLWWVTPLLMLASTGVSCLLIYWLAKLVSSLLK